MHALVLVIVPKIGPTLETEVSRLMESGWRDFETYETPCSWQRATPGILR